MGAAPVSDKDQAIAGQGGIGTTSPRALPDEALFDVVFLGGGDGVISEAGDEREGAGRISSPGERLDLVLDRYAWMKRTRCDCLRWLLMAGGVGSNWETDLNLERVFYYRRHYCGKKLTHGGPTYDLFFPFRSPNDGRPVICVSRRVRTEDWYAPCENSSTGDAMLVCAFKLNERRPLSPKWPVGFHPCQACTSTSKTQVFPAFKTFCPL